MTYTYNYDDPKYEEYVCVLSVLAQVAIDSAKRKFDVDVSKEIKRIKNEANVKEQKYPLFWTDIRKDFNRKNINKNLHCPMNYIHNIKITKMPYTNKHDYPMEYFFNFDKENKDIKMSKQVEKLISEFSLQLYKTKLINDDDKDEYLLLQANFEELISRIRSMSIGNKYKFIYSNLLARAFLVEKDTKDYALKSTLKKNRSILLKTLYEVNPDLLLECFSGRNIELIDVMDKEKTQVCIDCGKEFVITTNVTQKCRCDECQAKHKKLMTKQRVQKYRQNKAKCNAVLSN